MEVGGAVVRFLCIMYCHHTFEYPRLKSKALLKFVKTTAYRLNYRAMCTLL